jgi:hypothetical protein
MALSPDDYPGFFEMVLQQRGIVILLVKNIAQAPPCGTIFGFCSENKNWVPE